MPKKSLFIVLAFFTILVYPVFVSALAGGFTGTQTFSTYGSICEVGEPLICGNECRGSYWFSYEAPASGTLVITTDGSGFDTLLAVYSGKGASFDDLVKLGEDDDCGTDGKDSAVAVNVTKDEIYFIQTSGKNSDGQINITYNLYTGVVPEFGSCKSQTIVSAGGNVTTTVGASMTLSGSVRGGSGEKNYLWDFTANTASCLMQNRETLKPTLTCGQKGNSTARLSVYDSASCFNGSDSAQVEVGVAPLEADAGPDKTAGVNTTATIDGTALGGLSPYTYNWSFVANPSNSCSIQTPNSASTGLTCSATGVATLQLRVTDSQSPADTATDTVSVTIESGGTKSLNIDHLRADPNYCSREINISWQHLDSSTLPDMTYEILRSTSALGPFVSVTPSRFSYRTGFFNPPVAAVSDDEPRAWASSSGITTSAGFGFVAIFTDTVPEYRQYYYKVIAHAKSGSGLADAQAGPIPATSGPQSCELKLVSSVPACGTAVIETEPLENGTNTTVLLSVDRQQSRTDYGGIVYNLADISARPLENGTYSAFVSASPIGPYTYLGDPGTYSASLLHYSHNAPVGVYYYKITGTNPDGQTAQGGPIRVDTTVSDNHPGVCTAIPGECGGNIFVDWSDYVPAGFDGKPWDVSKRGFLNLWQRGYLLYRSKGNPESFDFSLFSPDGSSSGIFTNIPINIGSYTLATTGSVYSQFGNDYVNWRTTNPDVVIYRQSDHTDTGLESTQGYTYVAVPVMTKDYGFPIGYGAYVTDWLGPLESESSAACEPQPIQSCTFLPVDAQIPPNSSIEFQVTYSNFSPDPSVSGPDILDCGGGNKQNLSCSAGTCTATCTYADAGTYATSASITNSTQSAACTGQQVLVKETQPETMCEDVAGQVCQSPNCSEGFSRAQGTCSVGVCCKQDNGNEENNAVNFVSITIERVPPEKHLYMTDPPEPIALKVVLERKESNVVSADFKVMQLKVGGNEEVVAESRYGEGKIVFGSNIEEIPLSPAFMSDSFAAGNYIYTAVVTDVQTTTPEQKEEIVSDNASNTTITISDNTNAVPEIPPFAAVIVAIAISFIIRSSVSSGRASKSK